MCEISTIVSMLILMNMSEKGSFKRSHVRQGYFMSLLLAFGIKYPY